MVGNRVAEPSLSCVPSFVTGGIGIGALGSPAQLSSLLTVAISCISYTVIYTSKFVDNLLEVAVLVSIVAIVTKPLFSSCPSI